MGTADSLAPTKFILIGLQILLVITIYYTKQENIFAGLSSSAVYGDDSYDSANSSILGANTLSLICLIIELLVVFSGITLFFNRLNMLQIVLHALGNIMFAFFILGNWHYKTLWVLWGCLVLIPLITESIGAIAGNLYFRKLNR